MVIDTTSTRTADGRRPGAARRDGIGIGMVGYAFMGVAHSQGWRNARSFFDPALVPDLVAIGGRDAGRRDGHGPALRLAARRDRLARPRRPRRRRPRRHLHPRRHPRRDRDRGPRGRQARALREAAGQHRGRGARHGGGRRAGAGPRHPVDGGVHLPPRAGDRPGAPARAGGARRRDPPRARAVPAGLARRPRVAAHLAARRRTGRLGRPRRHRRPHHRPDPLHHRRADHRRQRDDRDLRRGASAPRAPCTGCRPRSAPGAGGSPSTTRRSSSPG